MPSSSRPPELQAIIDEVMRLGEFASVDEVNRHLAERTRDYNAAPQADLGGLSPDEMSQLLYGDWTTSGALRLNETLALAELRDVAMLADARTLLEFVATTGPVKETAAKYLPPKVVAVLMPQLRLPGQLRFAAAHNEPAAKKESDHLWLSALRQTLMYAKLLARRAGLRVTPKGRELLGDDRAGALYALLFRTFFRELDLRFFSASDEHSGLQSTVAYSFLKLRTVAREWQTSEVLAQQAWLASAKDPASALDKEYGDLRHYAFRQRVLEPLVEFGLLEQRELPSERRWDATVEYRVTPLFDRFLRVSFQGKTRRDPFRMR